MRSNQTKNSTEFRFIVSVSLIYLRTDFCFFLFGLNCFYCWWRWSIQHDLEPAHISGHFLFLCPSDGRTSASLSLSTENMFSNHILWVSWFNPTASNEIFGNGVGFINKTSDLSIIVSLSRPVFSLFVQPEPDWTRPGHQL